MKVATHVLQTKNAIWVKDMTLESTLGGSVKYSKTKSFQRALHAAEVELQFAKASIMNLASLGYFSQPERSTEYVDWREQGQQARLDEDGWLTLLMVDSEVRNLQKMVPRRVASAE